MSSHTIEDLTSCILDFQSNMVRVTYRRKSTVVEADEEPEHAASLNYIWQNSRVREDFGEDGSILKWRLLGCDTEDLAQEFGEVGVLGLDCLVSLRQFAGLDAVFVGCGLMCGCDMVQKHFVSQDTAFFANVIQEQLSRAPERRCPIVKASNEVVDLLSEHWAIFGPGCKLIFLTYGFSLVSSLISCGSFRLDVDDLPAVLPQLSPRACARDAFLLEDVERERGDKGGFLACCRVSPQPVRPATFPSGLKAHT